MLDLLRRTLAGALLAAALAGCGGDDAGSSIVGPGVGTGLGRVYPLVEATFTSVDDVPVSALYGPADLAEPHPVVILLHDISGEKGSWLTGTDLFVELLERGYLVVAIDLRGYGETPLPDDRQVPLLLDLETSFLDVHAVLTWLLGHPGADASRVALIGDGSGGNVAYVSMGVFPDLIDTAVSLSPGLWERTSLSPVVIGEGLDPFGPRSILYMVGTDDVLTGDGVSLSYPDFSRALAATTAEPTSVLTFPSDAHGVELINGAPGAMDSLLRWLDDNL